MIRKYGPSRAAITVSVNRLLVSIGLPFNRLKKASMVFPERFPK